MAVITAMKFNDYQGAIISDEKLVLIGNNGDPSNSKKVVSKIDSFKNKKNTSVVGCVSNKDFDFNYMMFDFKQKDFKKTKKIMSYFDAKLKEYAKKDEFKELIEKKEKYSLLDLFFEEDVKKEIPDDHSRDFLNNTFSKNGFSKNGSSNNNSSNGKNTHNNNDDDSFNNNFSHKENYFDFLVMSKDASKKINLYRSSELNNFKKIKRGYDVIGINANIGLLELAKFKDTKFSKNEHYDSCVGNLECLLSAARFSAVKDLKANKPRIYIFDYDDLITPNVEECNFLFDINKMILKQKISKEYGLEIIDSLIYKKNDIKDLVACFDKNLRNNGSSKKFYSLLSQC